jgi:hypothetical protein
MLALHLQDGGLIKWLRGSVGRQNRSRPGYAILYSRAAPASFLNNRLLVKLLSNPFAFASFHIWLARLNHLIFFKFLI